jgi:hypothetical protein
MKYFRLVFVCAALAGCGMPLEDYTLMLERNTADDPSEPDGGDGVSVIPGYDLQGYVPVPAAGAVPVKTVEGRRDLEGSAVWMDEDGNELDGDFNAFVLGAVYTARITLRAKEGYSFDGKMNFKYYPAGAVETQPADNAKTAVRSLSTVIYKATASPQSLTSAEVDLTNHIPEPVTGGSPVTSFHAGTYGGTVVWKLGAAEKPAGLFLGGKIYTAVVTLYPAPGWSFDGVTSVMYAGRSPLYDPDAREAEITFDRTYLGGGDASEGIDVGIEVRW